MDTNLLLRQKLSVESSRLASIRSIDAVLQAYPFNKDQSLIKLISNGKDLGGLIEEIVEHKLAFSLESCPENLCEGVCEVRDLQIEEQVHTGDDPAQNLMHGLQSRRFCCHAQKNLETNWTKNELVDCISWIDLSLKITANSKSWVSIDSAFFKALATAFYDSWAFFDENAIGAVLSFEKQVSLEQRLRSCLLDDCHIDAYRNLCEENSKNCQPNPSVFLRQAVINISAFNMLLKNSELTSRDSALPCLILSKMSLLLGQSLSALLEIPGGAIIQDIASIIADKLFREIHIAIINEGPIFESPFKETLNPQAFAHAYDSTNDQCNVASSRQSLVDESQLRPCFKVLEEGMNTIDLRSSGVVAQECIVLGSQPESLKGIVTSYNRLTERLQKAWTQQLLFTRSVGHELLNPLMLIGSMAHRLGGRLKDLNESDFLLIKSLEEESLKADRLVRDLIDLSLSESGELNIALEKISAFEVIKHLLGKIKQLSYASRIHHDELEALESYKLLTLKVSVERLDQCILNVLENAAKYSPELSSIQLKLSLSSDLECVFFDIRDHGCGISVGNEEKIFQPFFRGVDASRFVPGSGVGLALVKQLMDLMKGRIYLAESNASGTLMRLELPILR